MKADKAWRFPSKKNSFINVCYHSFNIFEAQNNLTEMDKSNVILFVVVFAVVAFRLYQKYFQKDKDKSFKQGGIKRNDTSIPSSSKDDDYEPYMKK